MAITRNIKVPIACTYCAITSLLLMVSVVTFVGTLAMKCEFLMLFGNYFDDYVDTPVLILVAGSVLVFADACLGLLSLTHRWYNGVIMFAACTACLLVAIVVLVTLAYVYTDTTERAMFSQLENDIKNHEGNIFAIKNMQMELECCGYGNSSDWTNKPNETIPQSCCVQSRSCDTSDYRQIHSISCYRALNDFFDRRKLIVVVFLGVVGLVEIMAIALSVVVSRLLRKKTTLSRVATDGSNVNTVLPRVHNPLGQSSLPSVDNDRNHEPYVRRPSLVPPVLNYRSPHENFLRQPPQLRFDRRVSLTASKPHNPHAVRSRWNN